MEQSTQQHDGGAAAEGIAGQGSEGAVDLDRFRIAFSIPDLTLDRVSGAKLTRTLRQVAVSAMEQTGNVCCFQPVGLRIHINARKIGKVQLTHVAHAVQNALRGVFYGSDECMCQLLITKAPSDSPAVHISCWEIK